MRLYPLLLSSFALAPALLAQRFPEVEPNGTAGTAQAIAVGTQIDANLVAAEEDWFAFTLPAATRIRIHTSSVDTRIALLDGSGTTYLGIDDDARTTTNGFSSEITLNIAAGSYKVQVVGFTNTTAGLYSLEVAELTPLVYDGIEAEAAPGANDTHLTAIPTGVLSAGVKRFHGNLAPSAVVLTDTVAAAPSATVFTGGSVTGSVVFTGSASTPTGALSTTTVTQTVCTVPLANPLFTAFTPAMSLVFTSGANIGLSRPISASTVFTVTTTAFPVAATSGDTYQIVTGPNSTTVTWTNSNPLASLFVGGSSYSVRMTSGANVGLSRAITANTGPSAFGSAVTTAAFPVANAPGDTFDIDMTVASTLVFRSTSALAAGAYSPTTGANSLGHFQVRFTSGTNAGLIRQIAGNTGSTITLQTALTAAPIAGDTYVVEQCDTDYYQIVLTAPNSGFWFQINEGDAPWVFGHKYEMYDSNGNALLPTGATQLPSFGTQNALCSTLSAHSSSARVLPAGTYYLAIRNPAAPFTAASVMPNGIVPFGNYLLELFTMPMDTAGIVSETEAIAGPNSNNTAATAVALATGQLGKGNLTLTSGADSTDWWGPFTVNTSGTITIQTRRGTTLTPMLDTTVNLRTATGGLLLAVTGGNVLDAPWTTTSLHARTTVTFYLAPTTFYIEVASPGTTAATQSGDYELEVSDIIAAPFVSASFTSLGGNSTAPCAVNVLTDAIPAATTALSGSVTATSTTTSVVTTGLTSGAWATGYALQMTSGVNNGLIRAISANTATAITVAAFPAIPAISDTWNIITANSTTFTRTTTALAPSAYISGFHQLRMTSGANNGLSRLITANAANTITTAAFPVASSSGDTFAITVGPGLTRQFVSEVPAMGALFARQLVNALPGVVYVHMIGFSDTLFGGSLPLPGDMTGLGATGCTLNVDPVLLTVGITDGAGTADIQTLLPPITAFRGFVWFEQAIVQNAAANPFGALFTNYARVITGERTY